MVVMNEGRSIPWGRLLSLLLIGLVLVSLSYTLLNKPDEPESRDSYTVVNTFPHDPEAFTQGLVFHDGFLFEGTGLRGQSSVRVVDLETGEVIDVHNLPQQYFGEGITIFGERIIQVTWKSRVGFVYDKQSLEVLDTFEIITEGWGLTHDGANLILSDGTSTLYFLDPENFEETHAVVVHDGDDYVRLINELENISGEIFANIWQTDRIARIDPLSGSVLGWLDLSGLKEHIEDISSIDVLNGIAYDEESGHLYVTGKLWPLLFEIELIPKTR
jgi:glutamine cyclotransferase